MQLTDKGDVFTHLQDYHHPFKNRPDSSLAIMFYEKRIQFYFCFIILTLEHKAPDKWLSLLEF